MMQPKHPAFKTLHGLKKLPGTGGEEIPPTATASKPNRVHVNNYKGNNQFAASAGQSIRNCFGCGGHKPTLGGKVLGPLKLWHCADCVATKGAKNGKRK